MDAPQEKIIEKPKRKHYDQDLLEKLLSSPNPMGRNKSSRPRSNIEVLQKVRHGHTGRRDIVEIKLADKNVAEIQALRQKPKINHASKEMALQKNSGIPIYKRFYKELQIKEDKINELKRSFA